LALTRLNHSRPHRDRFGHRELFGAEELDLGKRGKKFKENAVCLSGFLLRTIGAIAHKGGKATLQPREQKDRRHHHKCHGRAQVHHDRDVGDQKHSGTHTGTHDLRSKLCNQINICPQTSHVVSS
jgi:hypothetical protein